MRTWEEIQALAGTLPDATTPLVLLPVQLQTRFVVRDDRPQLLVRVYPDEIHLDAHEERLTAAEAGWGRRYWELVWGATEDAARARAWDALAERFGSQRAAWIVRRTTPTNLDARPQAPPAFQDTGPLRDDAVSAPVLARALPDRWVAVGYFGGRQVVLEAGAPIPEALAMSPGSDPRPEPSPPVPDTELALDPRMRWLVDFEEAERVGMAIRTTLPPGVPGLDTLVVFGIQTGVAPDAAAAALETLLEGHRHTGGLAFLAPGTPTNNTAETASGLGRDGGAGAVAVPAPRLDPAADGAAVARLLGIDDDAVASVDGAARFEDRAARSMQTALWPATGGYYLEQILTGIPPADLEAARRFFVDFVRAQGPLPVLRVGRQPYGLLPVMALDEYVHALPDVDRFVEWVRALRGAVRGGVGRVPRLKAGADDEERLVEILRMQPSSTGYRARLAFARESLAATGPAFPGSLPADLHMHAQLLRLHVEAMIGAGLAGDERVFEIVPGRNSRPVTMPLVQRDGEPPGYLRFLRTAPFDDILTERLPEPPGTLLYALARHSTLLAHATAAHRIAVRRRALPDAPFREPALIDVAGGPEPDPTLTLLRVLALDPALRASIHTLTAEQAPEAAVLEELREGLEHLETLPADALARHLTGCLDLFAYRYDTWATALATRRLDEIRRARPRGLALGGFGWVENLRQEPRPVIAEHPPGERFDGTLHASTERGGAIHAPSMGQAAAAAVLRSGYLTRNGDGAAQPFAIDLRSDRVRLAQFLLDGVREGQALGQLLGYRFERALHEHRLDRFVLGFRRVARLWELYAAQAHLAEAQQIPGREGIFAQRAAAAGLRRVRAELRGRYKLHHTASDAELEAFAERGVLDGLELAQLHAQGLVPFERVGPDGAAFQLELEAELRALDDAVDAVGDALTAEGVYQAVRGNPGRAAASVDAVAHGEIQPPELEVVQTPRPGAAVTHRLLVLFSAPPAAVPPAGPRGARAAAEPALEGWLRQMLGDLRNVSYRAEFVDATGKVVLRRTNQRLGTLVASQLDALHLAVAAEPGAPSELERLLEYGQWRAAPAEIPADARVRLLADRPAGMGTSLLSLGEFLELLRAFRDAILPARPLEGRDVAQAGDEVPSGADADELAARADTAVAALRRARDALAAPDDLGERLADFAFLGFPDAIPVAPRDADALEAQAAAVLAEANRRLALAGPPGIDRAKADADDRVRVDTERMRTVFGPAFKALPLVRPVNARELGSALRRSDELQGGDPLQALSWLQGAARVRPGASRLAGALMYAAALDRQPALELKVAQLPVEPGERWVALPPAAGGALPPGRVSLVAHLPRAFRADAPLAGLVVDEWVEVVPAAEITTGLAFNYDGPGARPPQTVLLAVAPGMDAWDVAMVEKTVKEALELAKLRAVDPKALGDDVLYQRALPALYVSLNLAGEAISTDLARPAPT